jgi:hypothetical protein
LCTPCISNIIIFVGRFLIHHWQSFYITIQAFNFSLLNYLLFSPECKKTRDNFKHIRLTALYSLWLHTERISHSAVSEIQCFLWWRAPQQKLRTHRSLEAYCATLWWR